MQFRLRFKDTSVTINRPRILDRMPPRKARAAFRTAFNTATVSDPAMIFTHHIDAYAWVGRLSLGGIGLYWNEAA